jgi:hypothetical protein
MPTMTTKKRIFASLLGLAMYLATVSDRGAVADAIAGSWSGASTNVSFGRQTQSQQGATANSMAGQSFTINYEGSPAFDPPQYFNDTVSGSVTASAGGNPSNLLQVTASAHSDNPGTLGDWVGTNVYGNAAASWNNDAAIVSGPAGASLPGTIRLNFTLTFSGANGFGEYSTLTASYNGTKLSYFGTDDPVFHPWGINPSPSNAGAVDSSTVTGKNNYSFGYAGNTVTDTFHIDLPVSKTGISDPFSLSLQLTPFEGLISNTTTNYSGLTAGIALNSVTLPDGTPLSALGDSVAFESGLSAPVAAPEPASFLAWGLVAAIAGLAASRRFRSGHPS